MLISGYYEKLQDKLSQIKDAREALDALREDHEEKLRQQAEETERQRQIMMAQKLEIMRKKKQVCSSSFSRILFLFAFVGMEKIVILRFRISWRYSL